MSYALWRLDSSPSGEIVHRPSFVELPRPWDNDVYRTITLRTVGIAAAVTHRHRAGVPARVLRGAVATPRVRNALLIAVVMPLWANYLVRVFAWKLILTPDGFLNWVVDDRDRRAPDRQLELGDLDHVHVPVAAVRDPADLRGARASPASYLEASATSAAGAGSTFRRVVWPLVVPGIVAGSIFAFSLTLGDYIAPELVGNTQFIGNVIYDSVGVAEQPAARRRVRARSGRHHGRLPAGREAARRVRGAVGADGDRAAGAIGCGVRARLAFLTSRS